MVEEGGNWQLLLQFISPPSLSIPSPANPSAAKKKPSYSTMLQTLVQKARGAGGIHRTGPSRGWTGVHKTTPSTVCYLNDWINTTGAFLLNYTPRLYISTVLHKCKLLLQQASPHHVFSGTASNKKGTFLDYFDSKHQAAEDWATRFVGFSTSIAASPQTALLIKTMERIKGTSTQWDAFQTTLSPLAFRAHGPRLKTHHVGIHTNALNPHHPPRLSSHFPVYLLPLNILPGWLQIWRFHTLLKFGHLPEQFTELKETLYLCQLIYYKGYSSGKAKWKRYIEQGMEKGLGASMPSLCVSSS